MKVDECKNDVKEFPRPEDGGQGAGTSQDHDKMRAEESEEPAKKKRRRSAA